MPSQSLNAALAVTRFGLGGRPGEIALAARDPAGYLLAQIRPAGADQPGLPGDDLSRRMAVFYQYNGRLKVLRAARKAAFAAAEAPGPGGGGGDYAGPVNRKGKPRLGPDGERLIRPKKDAGIAELHALVVADTRARLRFAATTSDAFRERWAQFWINHFTVGSRKAQNAMLNAAFEREAIRPHAFGRFADMATAAAHHPAMLLFLDQARSVGPNSRVGVARGWGLNENLARETLELHTLGAGAGYTQADVTEFAKALTGFGLVNRDRHPERAGGFAFNAGAHEPGGRTVLGRTYPGGGQEQADAVLAALAHDPRTARHLSTKVARHFIADQPPPALVAAIERAWLGSDGDLAKVAAALIRAPEAWAPAAAKVKTSYEFLVSCHRAAGMDANQEGAAPLALERLGQEMFSPPSPRGWPDEGAAWATPTAITDRLRFAGGYAAALPAADPAAVAETAPGARVSPALAAALARAANRTEALTLLFMSPEFLRR